MVLAAQRGRVGIEKNQHLLRAVDLPADLPEECAVGWENRLHALLRTSTDVVGYE